MAALDVLSVFAGPPMTGQWSVKRPLSRDLYSFQAEPLESVLIFFDFSRWATFYCQASSQHISFIISCNFCIFSYADMQSATRGGWWYRLWWHGGNIAWLSSHSGSFLCHFLWLFSLAKLQTSTDLQLALEKPTTPTPCSYGSNISSFEDLVIETIHFWAATWNCLDSDNDGKDLLKPISGFPLLILSFWFWFVTSINILKVALQIWPCGLMDKASDFGSEDCRFESCHGRNSFFTNNSLKL